MSLAKQSFKVSFDMEKNIPIDIAVNSWTPRKQK